MKAQYIGLTPCGGFQKGKQYYIRSDIQIVCVPFANFYRPAMCICIYDDDSSNWWYYKNIEEVLMNWKFN